MVMVTVMVTVMVILTKSDFLGARPSVSSNTDLWTSRGKMISHTLSLVRSSSMNSSKYVKLYPPTFASAFLQGGGGGGEREREKERD